MDKYQSTDSIFYQYDNNGNRVVRGTEGITWDTENRLISVSANGTEITGFIYDGDGNRAWKSKSGQEVLYINRYYEVDLT